MTRMIVLYDDRCPMCTFQSRLLTRLDWRGRIAVQPLSDPQSQQLADDIDGAELREAIHCFDSEGRVFRGARALRHIGMRLPLMVPLAALLWVPGVIFLAERVYSFISRNRHLMSRVLGCSAACRVLPERKHGAGGGEGSSEPQDNPLQVDRLEDRTHF